MNNIKFLILLLLVGFLGLNLVIGADTDTETDKDSNTGAVTEADTDTKTETGTGTEIAGFYFVNDNNYKKCTNDGKCEEVPYPTNTSTCSHDTTGTIIKTADGVFELCLGKIDEDIYPSIKFKNEIASEANYLVKHTPNENNVFNFNDEAFYYVIKLTNEGIEFDAESTFTDYCTDITGKITTRIEDFCSSEGSGFYYTSENGIVKSIHRQSDYSEVQKSLEDINYECTISISESDTCTTKKCDNYYVSEKNTNPSYLFVTREGKFVSDVNGKGFLIKVVSDKSCSVVTKSSVSGYYENPLSNKSTYPLIYCTGGYCSLKKIEEAKGKYYYLDAQDNKKLILCDETEDNGSSVMTCETKEIDNTFVGYYKNANSKNELIYCSEKKECNPTVGMNHFAYITSNPSEIIICQNDECEIGDGSKDKFYLNGGSDKITKPLLKYNSDKWVSTAAVKDFLCLNGIEPSSDNPGEKALILCTNTNSCNEIDAENSRIFISYTDNKIYKYDDVNEIWKDEDISLTSAKAYIVNSNFELLEKNGEKGKLVYCTVTTDQAGTTKTNCSVPSSYTTYYINAQNDGLIKMTSGIPNIVSGDEMKNGYYINSVSGTSPDIVVCGNEVCSKFSETKENCIDGVIITSKGKFCSKRDDEGKGSSFPTTTSKYILKIGDGKINGKSTDSYLFSVDGKTLHIIETTSTDYYLVSYTTKSGSTDKISENAFVTKADTDGIVYECTNGQCTAQSFSDGTYYSNNDVNTAGKYAFIHCKTDNSVSKCALEANTDKTNYCVKDDKLMLCNSCSDTASNCIGQSAKDGFYLSNSEKKIISCNGNRCEDYSSTSVGYYLNQNITAPLVQCYNSMGSINCKYLITINEGYYIKEDEKLISCTSSSCKEIDNPEGWYKSGENGKAIIRCTKSTNGDIEKTLCTAYPVPIIGYYVNGNGQTTDGNYLIKCVLENTNVVCTETKPNSLSGDMYYANSASFYDGKSLIKCNLSSGCETVEGESKKYYINGETKQLIYCISKNICSPFTVSQKGWYVDSTDGDSNVNSRKLIGCDSKKVCSVVSPNKGYYLNGDPLTYYNPIIYFDGNKLESMKSKSNGWYINAESDVSNKEAIIRCTDRSTCVYKEVKTNACSPSNAGEFIKINEVISWCNGKGKTETLEASNGKYSIQYYGKSDLIPGVKLTSGTSGYAALIIEKNSVLLATNVDGYVYHEKSLYYCPSDKYGVCSLVTIENGYYVEYKGNTIYKCTSEKVGEEDITSCKDISSSSCESANIINNEKIRLCKDNNNDNAIKMENIKINELYALSSKLNKKFPFPGSSKDYVTANVDKYTIIFKEDIENNPCKSEENCKRKNDGTAVLEEYKYDYDTNYGYWDYNLESGALQKVFIPKYDSNSVLIHKLECNIGSVCVEREIAEEPITSFVVKDGVLSANTLSEENNVINTVISVGRYLDPFGKWIICGEDGVCEEEKDSDEDTNVKVEGGVISVSIDTGDTEKREPIKASTKHKKYLPKLHKRKGKKMKRSDDEEEEEEEYVEIYELSHVSYTNSSENKNIFIYINEEDEENSYKMIKSSKDENLIGMGYVCNNGKCNIISTTGTVRYYLNTVQIGTNKNELVKCGGSEGKCEFITVGQGESLMYENAASKSVDDALIKCESNGCQLIGITSEFGLPNCMKEEGKDAPKEKCDSNDENCKYVTESGVELESDQYCIYNKVIYGKDDEIKEGINMFDVTYRLIDHSLVNESHVFSSLYNCISVGRSIKCNQTYGIIANNNKGYSKCTSSGCTYYTSTKITTCDLAGTGNIAFDGNDYSICTNDGSQKFKLALEGGGTKENEGVYFADINVNDGFSESKFGDQILIAFKDMVAYLIINDGYILIDNEKKIVTENSKSGNTLYECNSLNNNCIKVEITSKTYGYYYTTFSENLISCSNTGCSIASYDTDNDGNKDIVFPEEGIITYKYVSNGFPGFENVKVIVQATNLKQVVFRADNYILLDEKNNELATKTTSSDKLYFCNSQTGKCELSVNDNGKPYSGWYISGDDQFAAIKCQVGVCSMIVELPKSCSNFGDLIFNKLYQICITKSPSNLSDIAGTIKTINQSNTLNKFPFDVNEGDINIIMIDSKSNSVIGVGYESPEKSGSNYKVESSLVISECVNNGCPSSFTEANMYCFSKGSMYYTENTNGSVSCSGSKLSNKVVVLNGSKLATENDASIGSKMYYCDSNSSCRITTGYAKIGSKWFKCDSTKCSDLTESTNTLQGDLNSNGELRVSDTDNSISNGNYFYISGSNNFPGAETVESFLVEIGENYATIFKGDGYFLIDSSNNMARDDPEAAISNKRKRESNVANGNNLYYCSSTTMACAEQNEVTNGYFLNGGAKTTVKGQINSIIYCSSGNCELANSENKSIEYSTTTCSDQLIGRLIRSPDRKTVKLCTGKTSTEQFITSSSSNAKYKLLTLNKGNTFGDVSIGSTEENTNDKAVILIKITNLSITQYIKEGYIVYSSSNEILEGNGKGNLYLCEKRIYNTGSEVETVQCGEVSNINSGFYFNDKFEDMRYIECVENNCKVVEAKETNECTSSGSLIYNNRKFKLCQSLNKQVVIGNNDYNAIMNVSNMKEFPGISANNTEIIVSLNKFNVHLVKWNSFKVVNPDDMKLIEEVNPNSDFSSGGILYNCESNGVCNKIVAPYENWYLKNNKTNIAEELVYCSGGPGDDKCVAYMKPNDGYYISGNKNKPIIQCIQTGYETEENNFIIDTSENKIICTERDFIEGWMLNGELKGESEIEKHKPDIKPLINCNSEIGCKESNIEGNGWYINSAYKYGNNYGTTKVTNTVISPIIQCTSYDCNEYKTTIGNTCTKGGELILVNKKYKLCTKKGTSVDFENVSGTVYQIVEIANYGDFPDADNSKGYILVKITKNEVVQDSRDENLYILKDKVMYICNLGTCSIISEDSNNGIIVFETLSQNLYTASCSNSKCSWTNYNKEDVVFVTEENVIFKNTEGQEFSKIKYVYKCKKNDNRELVCMELFDSGIINNESKSYLYNSNHYNAESKKTVNTLYIYDNGAWGEFKDVTKCSPLTYKQNICYVSYSDEYYTKQIDEDGKENKVVAGNICETTNGKFYFAFNEINTGIDNINCIALPIDSAVNYYNINKEVYTVDKFGVYKLNGKNYINSITSNLIKNENENNKYIKGIWRENSLYGNDNIVTCTNDSCNVDKTTSCTYDNIKEKCKLKTGNLNAGQICISSNGITYLAINKLSTTEGDCVRFNEEEYSLPDEENSIYERETKWKYYVIDEVMYRINENEVEVLGEGVYVIDNAHYLVTMYSYYNMDISINSQYSLYVCKSEGCVRKTACENGSNFEYIFDGSKKDIIKCNPETNTITHVHDPGYYLNKPWNDIVKCYNDGICKEYGVSEGMEGYYINEGNEGYMIICKREGEKFACVEDKLIECTFNERESVCSSFKDLLRNSYCYYSVVDKILGKIEKLIYVENFIKSGSEGKCITGNENEYFMKYKKSKFLGHSERPDLIRVNKDSIVSIYEPTIGYYIIDTKEGKGITEDKYLKKTRMYICQKGNCEEERKPKENEIYINKASSEKLIKYSSGKWEIMKQRCDLISGNASKCKINGNQINKGDILYTVVDDAINMYATKVDVKGSSVITNNELLVKKTFINNGYLYLFNENMQSFTRKTGSYYFFEKRVDDLEYNLTPYKSTVNITVNDALIVSSSEYYTEGYYWNQADIDGNGIVIQSMIIPDKVKVEALSNNENTNTREEINTTKVVKAILNKCIIKSRNICINTQEGQTINRGSPCVVTEGDYKGLYIAIAPITKSSGTTNCVRYDSGVSTICNYNNGICTKVSDGKVLLNNEYCIVPSEGVMVGSQNGMCSQKNINNSYQYIGAGKERNAYVFGELYENILLNINKYSIVPFKHDYLTAVNDGRDGHIDYGYYVFDEGQTDGKILFNSETLKTGTAYKCDYKKEKPSNSEDEVEIGYSCELFNKANGYYYVEGNVMYGNNAKWKVETADGYYFFNEDHLPAKISEVDGIEDIDEISSKYKVLGKAEIAYNGKYLNSAVPATTKNDKPIIIVTENHEGGVSSDNYQISKDYKLCETSSNGSCKSRNTDESLTSDDVCYDFKTGNLYVVDVITLDDESQTQNIMCYTGSMDHYKYKLIGSTLYQLDGLSVQKVDKGYYILNSSMERFNSNYPEVPYTIIYCEDESCLEVTEKLNKDQTVMVNNAKVYKYSSYDMLMYYNENTEEKFKDISSSDNKCYCLNVDYEVPSTTSENNSCEYQTGDCSGAIHLNYASTGSNMILESNSNTDSVDFNYNSILDALEFKGEYNLNSNKREFKFIDKYLYLLYQRKMVRLLEEGIYLMLNGVPFDSDEWTSLSGDTEVCYYTYPGCNTDYIKIYRKYKYNLNRAVNGISIIEYDEERDMWRTVKEDGFYFFFIDEYSITAEDRRVEAVYEIKNGITKDITSTMKNNGFHIFNDLVVERTSKSWEDGEAVVENVETKSKKKCKAIETNDTIENDEFCYSGKNGLCVVKTMLSDTIVNANNCMFGEERPYYYIIDNTLYIVNDKSYQKVNNKGLYVIDNDNLAFDNRKESQANAYLCENGKCKLLNELETQYYYNSANGDVLYYNGNSKLWKKNNEKGDYFFNDLGKPINTGETIVNKVINTKNSNRYINKSNPNKNIMVKIVNNSYIALEITECEVNAGIINSKIKLSIGDNCIADGKLILISGIQSNKRQEGEKEEEYSYIGFEIDEESTTEKIIYDESEKKFIRVVGNIVTDINIPTGTVILKKEDSSILSGYEPTEAEAYDCNKEKKVCTLIDNENLVIDKLYVNAIRNNELVKYIGEGQWKVHDEIGYYFFDSKINPVIEKAIAQYAYEIYKENGKIIQKSIIDENIVGYFLNNANNNKYLISNNSHYWSKGTLMHACNVTVVEDGILCKTNNETISYATGDYCYKSSTKEIYLLISEASISSESANCILASNSQPKYIDSSMIGNELNNVEVNNRLIELTGNAIRPAKAGYYIVDGNYTLTDNNNEETETTIYSCTNTECETIVNLEDGEKIIVNDGTMFEIDDEGHLKKVTDDGLYFFNSEGKLCTNEECTISEIIRITEGVSEVIEKDLLNEGVYVNAGDKKSVGIYDGNDWSISSLECTYVESSKSCSNDDIELGIGSYCIADGKIYVIYEINEEMNEKKCIPGSNEKPLYITNVNGELMKINKENIEIIDGEGYYAYNAKTLEALSSEEEVESKLVRCDSENCTIVIPSIGSYLNKSPNEDNIAQFTENEVGKAKTIEKTCNVNGESCTVTDGGSLSVGDICINESTLYLVDEQSKCYMVDRNIDNYRVVGGKLYMLADDSVIQKFDGYYFLNKMNRAITNKKEYSESGVVGYMCSNVGDCFQIQPRPDRLYPDYTTKKGNKFTVLRFDPDKLSKRDEGSSGYESITEEGIFKMDDGSYAECEFDNNDEISCHNIENVGTYKSDVDETGEGELINCTKNEEGEVECIQASEGGYYVVNDSLVSCIPNEDKDKLVCSDMDKEGYFISNSNGDLYKCDEIQETEKVDTASISSVFEKLDAMNIMIKRSEEDTLPPDTNPVEEAENENTNSTSTTEETTPTTEITIPTPTPKDVSCAVVKCENENEKITFLTEEGEKELYICKNVKEVNPETDETNIEDEENEEDMRWVAQGDCTCYVMLGEYYSCDDDKGEIEKIDKPNKEHISTSVDYTLTTKKTTVTTTTTSTTTESITNEATTATKSTSKTEKATSTTTTKKNETTKTSTTAGGAASKTTTTTKPAATTTTTGGALSIRNIPSFTFYLILFVFTYYILL
ncbi:scaffoldin, partial [Neocallimastix sp. 'constans']